MASDKKQFGRALARWDSLHAEQRYSVPDEKGTTAILCPRYGYGANLCQRVADFMRLREEARWIKRDLEMARRSVYLALNVSYDVAETVFTDPNISSVITIGNGDLASLDVSNDDDIDWRDVSRLATHLKTDYFMQRQCGNINERVSVPLGTFAMSSHTDVHASVGQSFAPELLRHEADIGVEEAKIQPVTSHRRLTYEIAKELFGDQSHRKSSDETS